MAVKAVRNAPEVEVTDEWLDHDAALADLLGYPFVETRTIEVFGAPNEAEWNGDGVGSFAIRSIVTLDRFRQEHLTMPFPWWIW